MWWAVLVSELLEVGMFLCLQHSIHFLRACFGHAFLISLPYILFILCSASFVDANLWLPLSTNACRSLNRFFYPVRLLKGTRRHLIVCLLFPPNHLYF